MATLVNDKYPVGTPSVDFETPSLRTSTFSPATVSTGIVDNYSAVNNATLRNSHGQQISLVQNFVNSTYLGREDVPVLSGFITNLKSDYINVHDSIDLINDTDIFTLRPYGGEVYKLADANEKLEFNVDEVKLSAVSVSGPNPYTEMTRASGFIHHFGHSSHYASMDYTNGFIQGGLGNYVALNSSKLIATAPNPSSLFYIQGNKLELASINSWTDVFGASELGLRSSGNINVVSHSENSNISISAEQPNNNIYVTASNDISLLANAGTLDVVGNGDVHLESTLNQVRIQGVAEQDGDAGIEVVSNGKIQMEMTKTTADGLVATFAGFNKTVIGKTDTDTYVYGTLIPENFDIGSTILDVINVNNLVVNETMNVDATNVNIESSDTMYWNGDIEYVGNFSPSNIATDMGKVFQEWSFIHAAYIGSCRNHNTYADNYIKFGTGAGNAGIDIISRERFDVESVGGISIESGSSIDIEAGTTASINLNGRVLNTQSINQLWLYAGDEIRLENNSTDAAINMPEGTPGKIDVVGTINMSEGDIDLTVEGDKLEYNYTSITQYSTTIQKSYLDNNNISMTSSYQSHQSSTYNSSNVNIDYNSMDFSYAANAGSYNTSYGIGNIASTRNFEIRSEKQIDVVGDTGGVSTLDGVLYLSSTYDTQLASPNAQAGQIGIVGDRDVYISSTGTTSQVHVNATNDIWLETTVGDIFMTSEDNIYLGYWSGTTLKKYKSVTKTISGVTGLTDGEYLFFEATTDAFPS